MKILLVITLFLGFFGISRADESYPQEISKVTFAQGFWDGGSILIQFHDETNCEWKVLLDRSLDTPKEDYNCIRLAPVPLNDQELVPMVPQSDSGEKKLLSMIKKYFEKLKPSESDEYIFLQKFIELKENTQQVAGGDAAR
mgnify:FL=1